MDEQTRKDIWFSSNGTDCAAWLYASTEGKLPVIVMAHGLGSTRDMRIDAFAAAFSEAGFACFLFDYRNNGDSKTNPNALKIISKDLFKNREPLFKRVK